MEEKKSLAKIAAALSDPIRLEILELLVGGRLPCCQSKPHPDVPQAISPYLDLLPMLGSEMTASKLSYHLKTLRDAGLVEEFRCGKQASYLPNQQALLDYTERIKTAYVIPLCQDRTTTVEK